MTSEFDNLQPIVGERRIPLWRGPHVDGITFSLLNNFIPCRHRFYLQTIMGLREPMGFNLAIEYGSLWHAGEEALAAEPFTTPQEVWKRCHEAIRDYRNKLRKTYPADASDINKWTDICLRQFMEYLRAWKHEEGSLERTPVLQEVPFRVPYTLPSGRSLILRGMFDSVWLMKPPYTPSEEELATLALKARGSGRSRRNTPDQQSSSPKNSKDRPQGIWLQENKSKGTIYEQEISDTLHLNLQAMLYLAALRTAYCPISGKLSYLDKVPVGAETVSWSPLNKNHGQISVQLPRELEVQGIYYNVIRRPLAEYYPKLRKSAKEDDNRFHTRVQEHIKQNFSYYFMRFQRPVEESEHQLFLDRVFHPLLEQLLDWWDWIQIDPKNPWRRCNSRGIIGGGVHWQAPWGCYNSLAAGWHGDYYRYLSKGNYMGLEPVETLFPELALEQSDANSD